MMPHHPRRPGLGDDVRVKIRTAAGVADALHRGEPVVALESTLLAHGIPAGRNRLLGERLEQRVRAVGAVPATMAVLDGVPVVGLSDTELDRVCDPAAALAKLSDRDLGPAMAAGASGATTVAATAVLAAAAGIRTFGTGGLGGVHRTRGGEPSRDVSADLGVLARTPVLVVCSGVKSILDVPATLEVLETNSVPVLGYRTDNFPLFYLRESSCPLTWRVDDPAQASAAAEAHWGLPGGRCGMVLANPVPPEAEMDPRRHDELLAGAMELLAEREVRGGDVTPVMLEYFHSASGGASLTANEALVECNAALAGEVAVALSCR
jgi:pseudouridine-5'-phosphate glycosidase